MTFPAWLIVILIGSHVAVHILKHGEPAGEYNGVEAVVNGLLAAGLLYWAGLFI